MGDRSKTLDWEWAREEVIEDGTEDIYLSLQLAEPAPSPVLPYANSMKAPQLSETYPICNSLSFESLESQMSSKRSTPSYYRVYSVDSKHANYQLLSTATRVPRRISHYLTVQWRYWLGARLRLPKLTRLFSRGISRRRMLALWCMIVMLVIPSFLISAILVYGGIPPSYTTLEEAENALPQHHWSSYGGKDTLAPTLISHIDKMGSGAEKGKEMYLRFPDHLWGHGLNNVLQEAILTNHLALKLNRTPVFEDYTWSKLPFKYTIYDFSLRPTRIPLGAFIGGFLGGQVGVPYESISRRGERRAISAAYFNFVCPPQEVVEIMYGWPEEMHMTEIGSESGRQIDTGSEILEWFERRMSEPDVKSNSCVVIKERRKIFDFNFFGSDRMLGMLPELLKSPVLQQFEWSSLVTSATKKVLQELYGSSIHYSNSSALQDPSDLATTFGTDPNELSTVLALHLRMGDYKRHCTRLMDWGSGYMGAMRLLSDHSHPLENWEQYAINSSTATMNIQAILDEGKAVRKSYFFQHCLPNVQQIVRRLGEIRQEYDDSNINTKNLQRKNPHRLKHVYVLTNAWPSFLNDLRRGLMAEGWTSVSATPDWEETSPSRTCRENGSLIVDMSREERGVSVAIDMQIAQRAEVFVGNGFSSLSANVVMFRLVKGHKMNSNRLL